MKANKFDSFAELTDALQKLLDKGILGVSVYKVNNIWYMKWEVRREKEM
jgi:hypothetical protein